MMHVLVLMLERARAHTYKHTEHFVRMDGWMNSCVYVYVSRVAGKTEPNDVRIGSSHSMLCALCVSYILRSSLLHHTISMFYEHAESNNKKLSTDC